MTTMDELLRELGRRSPSLQSGPPVIEAEALAEAHALVAAGKAPPAEAAPWAGDEWSTLFCAEPLPGEADAAPSAAALAAVRGMMAPSAVDQAVGYVLRLVDDTLAIIRHGGSLLSAQPLSVRGAAAAAQPISAQHTFRQQLAGFDASVGLEAEGDGRFGITLTVEGEARIDPALRVTLWEGDRRRAVQSGDGAVHIGGLLCGSYRLEVIAEGSPLGAIELQVHDGEPGD